MERIPVVGAVRPNRADRPKDKDYHSEFGKWAVMACQGAKYQEHMRAIETNRNYCMANKQWDNREDIDSFLNDTNGKTTNRVKVEMNYLQILVNHHVGNAARMSMRAKCQSFSPLVKTRKELALQEMLMWGDVAKQSSPEYASLIKANKPVGESEQETVKSHDNYYCDKYVQSMNGLMRYTETVNNFEQMKLEAAESMAITGMCIEKPEAMSSDYRFRWVQTENFLFDREARKYDLSDCSCMGEYYPALATEVYERIMLSNDDILQIEAQNISFNTDDRLQVYLMYWRDIEMETWGYVKDEFNDIILVKIDYVYENDEKPKYTKADVVSTSELTPYQLNIIKKKKGKGKGMTVLASEVWRYCEFVPAGAFMLKSQMQGKQRSSDLVLSYGLMPYQERNIYSAYNMQPPYKVAMYFYNNGYVNSPMDIAINPQRMANRIMSAVENMLNNSRSSGTIIAEEAVLKSTTNKSMADIDIKMKRGDTVALPMLAFGGGNNMVMKYDGGIGSGANNLINLSQMFLTSIESLTGVNQAMKGQIDSPDQLVGTMQLMIQRGSITQERFAMAMRELFKSMYQAVATSGKRLYINERPKLNMMVGEEGAMVLELSRDMLMEDFRASVEFKEDKETERQFVDQMVMQLLQFQLLDRQRAVNLTGRGTTEEMWMSAREYAKELAEVEAKQAEAAQQMAARQQQLGQQQQAVAVDQEQQKIDNKLLADMTKTQKDNAPKPAE